MFSNFGKGSKEQQELDKKDFKKLECELIKMCTDQCLRRERIYESESQLCNAKCYDLGYIYLRIGLAELNSFAYDNNIKM